MFVVTYELSKIIHLRNFCQLQSIELLRLTIFSTFELISLAHSFSFEWKPCHDFNFRCKIDVDENWMGNLYSRCVFETNMKFSNKQKRTTKTQLILSFSVFIFAWMYDIINLLLEKFFHIYKNCLAKIYLLSTVRVRLP